MIAAPGCCQRNEQFDIRKLYAIIHKKGSGDQPAHTVGHHMHLLELVFGLQVDQLPEQ